jgi:hypothetical protein
LHFVCGEERLAPVLMERINANSGSDAIPSLQRAAASGLLRRPTTRGNDMKRLNVALAATALLALAACGSRTANNTAAINTTNDVYDVAPDSLTANDVGTSNDSSAGNASSSGNASGNASGAASNASGNSH